MINSYQQNTQSKVRPAKLQPPVAQEFIDIHCHCLPNIDDGPDTLEQSIALCRILALDGVTSVIATPHQLGTYQQKNTPETIRQAVADLNNHLINESIPLKILPGADIRIEKNIPELLKTDQILTLADNHRYLLLEQPHKSIVDMELLLTELSAMSVTAIISHPERNDYLKQHLDAVTPWLEGNAHLQITAGSMLGYFGSDTEQAAWYYVTSGMASLVATDAHDLTDRCPRMLEAFYAISERLGEKTAQILCLENPRCVLAGKEIICSRP